MGEKSPVVLSTLEQLLAEHGLPEELPLLALKHCCCGECPDVPDDSSEVNPEWVAMQREQEIGHPLARPAMFH